MPILLSLVLLFAFNASIAVSDTKVETKYESAKYTNYLNMKVFETPPSFLKDAKSNLKRNTAEDWETPEQQPELD
ncbi:MAG: hypothetical protein WCT77_07890 [Bacteroidota bacterium]